MSMIYDRNSITIAGIKVIHHGSFGAKRTGWTSNYDGTYLKTVDGRVMACLPVGDGYCKPNPGKLVVNYARWLIS